MALESFPFLTTEEMKMNSPTPVSPPSVPAATPTIGAVLGGLASVAITQHVSDPTAAGALVTLVPALFAWIAHKLHATWLSSSI